MLKEVFVIVLPLKEGVARLYIMDADGNRSGLFNLEAPVLLKNQLTHQ